MKNIYTHIVNFVLVVSLLVAWNLIGREVPSFGWFLSQPVVVITEIMVTIGTMAKMFVEILGEMKN